MTHPKEAMRYLSNLLWCAADNEGLESDFAGTAAMALDRLAPMLTARAEADKAAAVEACAAVADKAAIARQAQMDGPNRKDDRMQQERWRVGKQQAEIIAAAIRAYLAGGAA
jgi:hypothetical protein